MKKELTARQRKVLRQKECFAKSETLREAFFMLNRGIDAHARFLHYTTLPRVVQMLTSGCWWLTRADAGHLNDAHEAKKYGDPKLLCRMYQASFAYGSAESAAMWGLYCPGNPLGVMISVNGAEMRKWFAEIRRKKSKVCLEYDRACAKHGRQVELSKRQIDIADARDVIYAATDFKCPVRHRRGKKNRSHKLFWFGMSTGRIDNLEQEINEDVFSGWIKDSEWQQENESRVGVRVKSITGRLPDHLSIAIPDYIYKSMRFTLSPWLKEEYYCEIESMVRALFMRFHGEKLPQRIVASSGLTGALESWRARYGAHIATNKD